MQNIFYALKSTFYDSYSETFLYVIEIHIYFLIFLVRTRSLFDRNLDQIQNEKNISLKPKVGLTSNQPVNLSLSGASRHLKKK